MHPRKRCSCSVSPWHFLSRRVAKSVRNCIGATYDTYAIRFFSGVVWRRNAVPIMCRLINLVVGISLPASLQEAEISPSTVSCFHYVDDFCINSLPKHLFQVLFNFAGDACSYLARLRAKLFIRLYQFCVSNVIFCFSENRSRIFIPQLPCWMQS